MGENNSLYPFVAQIETAVNNCKTALANQVTALNAVGVANTALAISKIALVPQYNANFFAAAIDIDKNFAERLFPKLRSPKKKIDDDDSDLPGTVKFCHINFAIRCIMPCLRCMEISIPCI